ncbi:hypothetical protein [Yeosuana marina]|jgi:hypothetical protein|uniref:hypothetical protein n=1 Tax=Yeosuana marina TaxID=1565536 RepID=UPI00141E34C0|nr:hypothetical protein [Yeosuana marina]|tara:strand:+ start:3412 stop:3879 length:468 start_codon:yes stop_codon:yes gene_type:complete
MVLNNIEKLLEKYENGETTLKEEQVLKNYFTSDTVAPHLEIYKPMFAYFLGNQQEQFTKDVPLKTKNKFNYKWLSVAAVAVLMIGFYFKSTTQNELGTYEDPQKAYNEVVKSLAMISTQFNKGASTVGYLDELNKGTATLGYLNEIENTKNLIFK